MDVNKKNLYINTLLCAMLLLAIVWQFNKPDAYYHWFCNNLIKTNFEYIYFSDADLTEEQKSEAKLGTSYFFLQLIKKSTPDDAVILFPESHVFADKSNQVEFNGYMNRKGYVRYFLYPRQVIYENEKDTNKKYSNISHVAIVNGWGYDKLNYTVPDRIPYSVLPVHNPTSN